MTCFIQKPMLVEYNADFISCRS